ncbi:hypothetical protein MRX96_015678 [Rhipicephalus microplus]
MGLRHLIAGPTLLVGVALLSAFCLSTVLSACPTSSTPSLSPFRRRRRSSDVTHRCGRKVPPPRVSWSLHLDPFAGPSTAEGGGCGGLHLSMRCRRRRFHFRACAHVRRRVATCRDVEKRLWRLPASVAALVVVF